MARPVDLTAPLGSSTPTFPGDPPIRVLAVRSLARGDPYALSTLALGSHSGTHLDAPSHFVPGGAAVDTADLELLNGPALVLEVPEGARAIGASELPAWPSGTLRVLFRTRNSARFAAGEGFFDDFVALTDAAAAVLLERGVRLVGVDGLSVERDPSRSFPVHHRLLGGGAWILEGLRLADARAGVHELRCLPLRLTGADGSPCRAALWT